MKKKKLFWDIIIGIQVILFLVFWAVYSYKQLMHVWQ